MCGTATTLPMKRNAIASTEPSAPQSRPSTMNGPRTNQFVAPTSFITSISRRREKIDRRIVFAISSTDANSRTTLATANDQSSSARPVEDDVRRPFAVADQVDARRLGAA